MTDGIGCAATLTVTESDALPFTPLQVRVYVLFEVRLVLLSEPEVVLLPDQAPEAVQVETLPVVQESVVEPL